MIEYRQLGRSGFVVPVLSLGTATFGGGNAHFKAWGDTDAQGARRLVDICLDHGLTMFDTADVYSLGLAEEVLGAAIEGRRNRLFISTKATFRFSNAPNDVGASRHHLIAAVEGSLRRLGTDHIDLFQLHGPDDLTPIEETLTTLEGLVQAGKIRYVGCSNFSGWQLMKAQAVARQLSLSPLVSHQVYYSLIGRDYEWELMPLGRDQSISATVWSPLGWGRLTGRIRRGSGIPTVSRLHETAKDGPPVQDELLFRVIDAALEIGEETGKSIAQIAINWLLSRPTVASVVIGVRDEKQLLDNLGSVGWSLTPQQIARLDAASEIPRPYPYWHQEIWGKSGTKRDWLLTSN